MLFFVSLLEQDVFLEILVATWAVDFLVSCAFFESKLRFAVRTLYVAVSFKITNFQILTLEKCLNYCVDAFKFTVFVQTLVDVF